MSGPHDPTPTLGALLARKARLEKENVRLARLTRAIHTARAGRLAWIVAAVGLLLAAETGGYAMVAPRPFFFLLRNVADLGSHGCRFGCPQDSGSLW